MIKSELGRKIKKRSFIYFLLIFLLALISSFRLLGEGADYGSYVKYFSDTSIHVEPAFALLRVVNLFLFNGNVFFIYFACTILALFLKFMFFESFSRYPFYSAFFYIISFYLLHEYTQIRVSVSIGLFFWAIEDLKNKNFKHYFLKFILAFCFHYTSVLWLPLYFYCTFKKKIYYLILPWGLFLSDLFIFNSFDIYGKFISLISKISGTVGLLVAGKIGHTVNSRLNVLNIYYLSLLIILTIMYLVNERIDSKQNLILIKIQSFALFLFYFFMNTNLPVLVFRTSEYFSVISVVLIVNIIASMKQKQLVLLVSLCFFLLQFYLFSTRTIFL